LFNGHSLVHAQNYLMSARRHPLLLTSIHDVSPRFESEVDRLLDQLRPHVGERLAMLVVPNHWSQAPIVAGSQFATRLRGWSDSGIEMFLHGYFHKDDAEHRGLDRLRATHMTAREGEFLGLTRDEAVRRISDGRSLLEAIIGKPITGFVAPAWLYGSGAHQALFDSSIRLAEDHWRVWSPETGRTLARGPVITWASRTAFRLRSSLIAAAVLRHAPIDVLRIGVHPPDCRSPQLMRSIGKTLSLAAIDRKPAAYSDLLYAA
jgi:hypothetical protein